MKSRVHPKYKTYRVANWPEYEQGLVRRGDVTILDVAGGDHYLDLLDPFFASVAERDGNLRALELEVEVDHPLHLLETTRVP